MKEYIDSQSLAYPDCPMLRPMQGLQKVELVGCLEGRLLQFDDSMERLLNFLKGMHYQPLCNIQEIRSFHSLLNGTDPFLASIKNHHITEYIENDEDEIKQLQRWISLEFVKGGRFSCQPSYEIKKGEEILMMQDFWMHYYFKAVGEFGVRGEETGQQKWINWCREADNTFRYITPKR